MQNTTSPIQNFVDDSELMTMDHIPAVARMCHKIGIIDIINDNIPCNTDIDLGTLVVGMICDTLSGRSPLYKVEEFIAAQDTELLFGMEVNPRNFNDDALGNALDRIHKKGTQKLFTEVSLKAAEVFLLDLATCNFDTTSVNVWGEYPESAANRKAPHITHGYSKDKRPDLKQFMVSMLCVEGNIPITGKMQNGNSSDDKLNNEELQNIANLLKPLRNNIEELIYVADCKLINSNNMEQLDQLKFISRFPANFKQHDQAIHQALDADQWQELGILAQTPSPSVNCKRASYKANETQVTINEKNYRAIVIQTDHLDKRRTKGIERRHLKAKQQIEKQIKAATKITYHCPNDAASALQNITALKKNQSWDIIGSITETPTYAPGRTPKNEERKIKSMKYQLLLAAKENTDYLNSELKKAGCFVMISNLTEDEKSAHEILKTYKSQYGIEQNFSFLKDPLIVNDTFLKKPSRIDALTFILLLSLMIWNLIQNQLRKSPEVSNGQLKNLNKSTTKRPTSYLFMSHLSGIIVLRHGAQRFLAKNTLREQAKLYLKALAHL
jgi:transposase